MNSTYKRICAVIIILIVLFIAIACTIYYMITSKQVTTTLTETINLPITKKEEECSNELYPHLDSQIEQCAKEKEDVIPDIVRDNIDKTHTNHNLDEEPEEVKHANAMDECITQIYPEYKQKIMECASQLN